MKKSIGIFWLLTLCTLAGCAQYESLRGVEVSWQSQLDSDLERGKTSRADVLSKLGPPSQVIALGDETVMYYLFEHSAGEGLVLVVYNRMTVDTRYDRAIFFFDSNDILTDYAVRAAGDDAP